MTDFYIKTFGCQMNAYDSEVISSMLKQAGLSPVNEPAKADVIIVNTCSIREHAETRAINWIHEFSRLNSTLVVCGCMAQRLGYNLLETVPGIDMVVGPDRYAELISLLKSGREGEERKVITDRDHRVTYGITGVYGSTKTSRYLSITRGCENFCTYCVVPYLRGKVRSKRPEEVLGEAKTMISEGAREITLLGQNVMAYGYRGTGFTDLAETILGETGIDRLRFLTTHPKDVTRGLFELMNRDRRLCPHIHLPLQSGSDRILSLMNRPYSRERYLSILSEARDLVPDLAVTTDIIVGFPTETDEDFKNTM